MANPDVLKKVRKGNWLFQIFLKSPNVIIGETKVKGYDEAWLDMIEEELTDRRFRVFIDRTGYEEYAKDKKHTRIEVYKKFKDGNYKDNIPAMLSILEEVFSMEVPEEDEEEDDV